MHAIFHHLLHFFEKMQTELIFDSEQAMESVHSDFKAVRKTYKISRNHENYLNSLKRAFHEYNSLHSI